MLRLRTTTSPAWVDAVCADVDRVPAGPRRQRAEGVRGARCSSPFSIRSGARWSTRWWRFARGELEHFARCTRCSARAARGSRRTRRITYMGALHRLVRRADVREFLLDRLLVFGVVEARACERFGLSPRPCPIRTCARSTPT